MIKMFYILIAYVYFVNYKFTNTPPSHDGILKKGKTNSSVMTVCTSTNPSVLLFY